MVDTHNGNGYVGHVDQVAAGHQGGVEVALEDHVDLLPREAVAEVEGHVRGQQHLGIRRQPDGVHTEEVLPHARLCITCKEKQKA